MHKKVALIFFLSKVLNLRKVFRIIIMGRSSKNFIKKKCVTKSMFKGKCSKKHIQVKPSQYNKLKELNIIINEKEFICTNCNIYISKIKRIEDLSKIKCEPDSTSECDDIEEIKNEIGGTEESDIKHIENEYWLSDYEELIRSLKSKFQETQEKNEKYQILTLLPTSWGEKKIQNEFGCTLYMARTAKQLRKTKGILSVPDAKTPSNILNTEIENIIQQFYIDDEISSVMPGKNDYISLRVNGVKQKVQKRLMLMTLKEAYQMLKKKYPKNFKFSFSYFASRRPQNCIFPGSSGTHTVCVCSIHENIKLMMMGKL